MAADEADLNFKMSKKIAQLTKVIYQLNCRNEDSDVFAKSVAERYESEISSIMADAKDKLTSLRDALQAKTDDDKVQRVVKEMTKIHQKERDEATKAFDTFREASIRNEQALKQNFEERTANMTRELTQCREDFSKMIRELRDANATATAAGKKELDELMTRKNKEIDDLVKEYNERYKSMLAQQLDEQDKIEKRLNEEWSKKLDALRSQLSGKSADASRLLAEEQAKVAKLTADIAAQAGELLRRQQLLDACEVDVSRLKQRNEHLDGSVAQLQTAVKKAEDALAGKLSRLQQVETELRATQSELDSSDAQLRSAKQAAEKFQSLHIAAENELAVLRQRVSSLESDLEGLRAEKARLGNEGSSLGTEVQRLNDRLRAAEAKLSDEQKQCATLTSSLAAASKERQSLEEQIEALRKKHDADVAQLKQTYEATLRNLQSSSSTSVESLTRKHKEEMEALRRELESDKTKALALLEGRFASERDGLVSSHRDAMQKAQSAFDASAKAASEKHKTETATLQGTIDDLRKKFSGDASAAQRELDELRASLAALQRSHATAMEENEARRRTTEEASQQTIRTLKAELADAHIALAKVREELSASQAVASEIPALKERIKALEKKLVDDLAALAAKHAKELTEASSGKDKEGAERLRAELEKLRKELTDRHEAEKSSLMKEHRQQMDTLRWASDQAAAASAAEIQRLERELAALRSDKSASDSAAAGATEALRQQLAAAQREYDRRTTELQAQHRSEQVALEGVLRQKHQTELQLQREAFERTIAELEAKLIRIGDDATLAQRNMEENFKNRTQSLEKRKDEEREKALAEMSARLGRELETLREARDREIADMKQAKHVVEREVATLTAELNQVKSKLEQLGRSRDADNEAHRKLVEDLKAESAASKKHYEASLETQAAAHVNEIASLRQGHEERVQALTTQFETEKKALQAKIKQLQKLVADLEYKYANRESRQEDVDKINQLLKDMKDKDAALLKAYDDMKFYKLELHNREENYNKMFGRQPSLASGTASGSANTVGAAAADGSTIQVKPPTNPSSAPSKMETATMPPNMKRKSIAAEK